MLTPRTGLGVGVVWGIVLAGSLAAFAAGEQGQVCAVPEAVEYSDAALPHVAASLKAGQPVRIVIVGSGSSVAGAANKTLQVYPERLAGELAKRFPEGRFEIVNLARRGQLADDMAGRFAKEVLTLRPALVIWQTGTVDAVRGVDLGSFGHTLGDGIEILESHGTDVILMDMQYSPHTSTALNVRPYRDYMRWVAQNRAVLLFDRYAMMKYWEEADIIDFSDPSKAHQAKDADLVHGCIAYLLAEMIHTAVAQALDSAAKP
jgi:hypothetical protein